MNAILDGGNRSMWTVMRPGLRERATAGYDASEDAVARTWMSARSLSATVRTTDGRSLRVLYPGRRSSAAGPDFRDCVLEAEDGDLITGDVEIHRTAADWRRHGHDVDPRYNGVVLHVVLKRAREATTRQQSRTVVPVVEIGTLMGDTAFPHDGEAIPIETARSLTGEQLERMLDEAGDARFSMRSHAFAMQLVEGPPAQVLYESIMEALGYSANRKPFRALARCVPYSLLLELREEPPASRLAACRAALITASGLMSSVEGADAERLRSIAGLLPRTPKLMADAWQTFRIRPANHPLRRIEGAALLADRWVVNGLLDFVTSATMLGEWKAIEAGLTAAPFVGQGRARDIAVNAALPFVHALAAVRRDTALRDAALALYRSAPRLEDNDVTREMRAVLALEERGIMVRTARRQQGLHHLYRQMARGRLHRSPEE